MADPVEETTTTTAVAATIEAGPIGGRVLAWTQQHEVVALSMDASMTGGTDERPEASTEVIARDVESVPALSPDGTQLLMVRPSGLAVLDVATGQESTLALVDEAAAPVAAAGCLSWSPDGARFTLRSVSGAIFVATTAGDARLVDAPKEAEYDVLGITRYSPLNGQPLPGETHRTMVSCGRWIDETRLVVQRSAQLPEEVYVDPANPAAPIPPDTTSVAVLEGDGVRLVDFGDRWYLRAACGDRWLVTDEPDGTDPDGAGTGPSRPDGPDAVGYVVVDDTAEFTAPGSEAGGDLLPAGDVVDRDNVTLRPGACELLASSPGSFDIVEATGETQATFAQVIHDAGDADVPTTMSPGMHAWEPGDDPVRLVHARRGYFGIDLLDLAAGTGTVVTSPGNPLEAILGWAPAP